MKETFLKFLTIGLLSVLAPQFYAQTPSESNFSEIKIELGNNENTQCFLDYSYPMLRYRAEGLYSGNTPYRIKIDKIENYYIYVLNSDNSDNVEIIYPSGSQYNSENINGILQLPEDDYLYLGNYGKKDYITVIYSDIPLDIELIAEDLSYISGDYYERLRKTLRHRNLDITPPDSEILRMVMNRAAFSTKEKPGILPITIEFFHQ